jgi:hemerythrin
VQEVERDLMAASAARHAERIVRDLGRLREELARHFEMEEAGGCLEDAACRCPRLSGEIARLEREHPLMLRMLDRLVERAATGDIGCETDDFVEAFRRLVKSLHAHEAAENHVMAEAFGSGEFEAEPSPTIPTADWNVHD